MKDRLYSTLREVRTQLGLSQQQLAERAGVSRQAITSIETGVNAPSTIVALRLARALGRRVEDLFKIEDESPTIEATPAQCGGPKHAGPVTLAQVDGRWIAHAADAESVPVDGKGEWVKGADAMSVRILSDECLHTPTIVVAGCAPALALWMRASERWHGNVRFHSVFANSTQALDALIGGEVHAAGIHLYNPETGEHNTPIVSRRIQGREAVIVNLGIWNEGLFVRPGNPFRIKGVEDLAQPGVTIVNREVGAGSRRVLDAALAHASLPSNQVTWIDRIASSHLEVAQTVAFGHAEVGIGPEPVAARYGLDFIPLQEVRYDVVVWRDALDFEPLQMLMDTLSQRRMRAQLELVGGFDTRLTGEVVGRLGC